MQLEELAIGDADPDEHIAFGSFRLWPNRRLLMHGDERVRMGSRALDILITLTERPGEVISHRELVQRAWPGLVVEGSNLRVHIVGLRKLLGCDGSRYVVNVPARGYVFTGIAPKSGNHIAPLREFLANLFPQQTGQAFVVLLPQASRSTAFSQ